MDKNKEWLEEMDINKKHYDFFFVIIAALGVSIFIGASLFILEIFLK